jgi:sugar phosphate isomerase/epimerase
MASLDPSAPERPLSLAYYTVPELSFIECIEVAADAGCRYVGARLLNGGPADPPTALLESAALRREANALMAMRGISALDASAARLRADTDVRAFEPLLCACAELGVRHVMCSIDDPDPQRRLDSVGRLCSMAARHRLRVEIEFVPWMAVASLTDAAEIVERAGADNLGIVVDALHFDRSHGRVEDILRMPATCFQLVQLCDAPACTDYSAADQIRVATQARCFPGEGDIALAALLQALPPTIPIALEIPTQDLARHMPARQRVARAVTATRELLARMAGTLEQSHA